MTADQDRLITVAIHTYDHAIKLKNILAGQGIEARLQNINLDHPVVAAGMRVRIKESDLPAALRIIENPEIFTRHSSECVESDTLLVPIDFSDYSLQACRMAFAIASVHKLSIVLLHSFTDPTYANMMQMSDVLTYDVANSESSQMFTSEAERLMTRFTSHLRELIKTGELPPVKFSTIVSEGLPEEVINSYAKEHCPNLIVMGTRGADQKERELVGSVTAEVLDTCRFPVFTVPEGVRISKMSDIKRILLFCDVDQEDMLVFQRLTAILPGCSPLVTLVNIPSKKQNIDQMNSSLLRLKKYFEEHYPNLTFDTGKLTTGNIEEDYNRLTELQHIDLIAVPNKKKSVFARLFNPGLAHRLLFRTDCPMMVIPV